MAGSPPPVEDTPKLGIKATIAALVFVVTILGGFGAATAASFNNSDADHGNDSHEADDHGDDSHDDDHSDEGDSHDDDSHEGDDDHS